MVTPNRFDFCQSYVIRVSNSILHACHTYYPQSWLMWYHSTISKHNINIARSGYTNFVHSGITIIMCQAIHSFSLSRFHIWRLCGIGIKAAQQLTTIQEGMSHTFGVFHRSQQVVSILLLNRMFHTFGNSSLAYIQWRLLNRSRVTARARRRELYSTSVLLVWAVSPSGYTVHCKY